MCICREERFNAAFSQHMMTNRLDQISVGAVAGVVNAGNPNPFTSQELDGLLEVFFIYACAQLVF